MRSAQLLRRFLVRKGTIRSFYEQTPAKQIFFRETERSEQWLAKYISFAFGTGLFFYSLSSLRRKPKFEPPYAERTNDRLKKTYGMFAGGLLITGGCAAVSKRYLAKLYPIMTNPTFARYICGGSAFFACFTSLLCMGEVLPKSASYPVWLINHVGLGLLAPNYAFVLGPFFLEACIFFGLTLGSMAVGAISSFTESEGQPNLLWNFYVGGAAMSCFVNYIMFPGLLYQYHYFYLFYLSYVYTRDSVRALQEIKRTGPKNFNPAYSALRMHFESWRRAGRGLLLLFTYFGKGNYADEH